MVCKGAVILDEATVEICKAQKTLQLLTGGRCWPICDSVDFSWVGLQLAVGNVDVVDQSLENSWGVSGNKWHDLMHEVTSRCVESRLSFSLTDEDQMI